MPFTSDGRWVPRKKDDEEKNKKIQYAPYRSYNDDKENRPSYEPSEQPRSRIDYGPAPDYDVSIGEMMGIKKKFPNLAPRQAVEGHERVPLGPDKEQQPILPFREGPQERQPIKRYTPYQGASEEPQELIRRYTPDRTENSGSLRDILVPPTTGPSEQPQRLISQRRAGTDEPNALQRGLTSAKNFLLPTEEYEKEHTSLSEILGRPLQSLTDTLTFGMSEKLDNAAGLKRYGEPTNFAEQVADKLGEGMGFLVGGKGIQQAAAPIARGVQATGRETANTARRLFRQPTRPNPLPGPNPNVPPTLTQELAGLGAGIGAFAVGQEVAEGMISPEAEEKNAFQTVGGNFTAGMYDFAAGTGSALRWAGAEETGESLKNWGEKGSERYATEYTKEFTWKSLLDPEWYQTTVARSVPSTLAFMPFGIVGYGAGLRVAGRLGLGTFGRTVAGAVGGAALQAPLESAMIAGSTYDEAISRGHDEETADTMGNEAFWKALLVSSVTQGLELGAMFAPINRFRPQLEIALRTLGSAGIEGSQEALQDWAQKTALGDEWNPSESGESFAIGALMGGAMGGISAVTDLGSRLNPVDATDGTGSANAPNPLPGDGSIVDPNNPLRQIQSRAREMMSDEMRTDFDAQVDEFRQEGLADDVAEFQAWEALAMTEEGQGLIERATRKFAEEQARAEVTQSEGTPNPVENLDSSNNTTPEIESTISGTTGQPTQTDGAPEVADGPTRTAMIDKLTGEEVKVLNYLGNRAAVVEYQDGTKKRINRSQLEKTRVPIDVPAAETEVTETAPTETGPAFGPQTTGEILPFPSAAPTETGPVFGPQSTGTIMPFSNVEPGTEADQNIEEPVEPIEGPPEDVTLSEDSPINLGSRVLVDEEGDTFSGEITDIDEFNGVSMAEVTFDDGDVQLYPMDRLRPEGQTGAAPTGPVMGPAPTGDILPMPTTATADTATEEEVPETQPEATEEISVMDNSNDVREWFNRQPFSPTHIGAGDTEIQAVYIQKGKDGDIWAAQRRGEDRKSSMIPLTALENHVTRRIPGATTYHFRMGLDTRMVTFGEGDEIANEQVVAERPQEQAIEEATTTPAPTQEETTTTPVPTQEETSLNFEVKEMKNGNQKVVINVPNSKRKAEFLFFGEKDNARVGTLNSAALREGKTTINTSPSLVLDAIGLPKDLILKTENLIAALEGRDYQTVGNEISDIEFTDYNMKPHEVRNQIIEDWKDLPFIPDFKRRGVPVQTYFFRDQAGKEYVIFREEGKDPGQPQFANVFLKTAEPMSLNDPELDWLKDMIDNLPSQGGTVTEEDVEDTIRGVTADEAAQIVGDSDQAILGTDTNIKENVRIGDYVVEHGGDIVSQIVGMNPLRSQFSNFADREIIHIQEREDLPTGIEYVQDQNKKFILVIDHMLDALNLKTTINTLIEDNNRKVANSLIKKYAPGYGGKRGNFYFHIQPEKGEIASRIYIGRIDGKKRKDTGNMPLNDARKMFEDNLERIEEIRNQAEQSTVDNVIRVTIDEDETGYLLRFQDNDDLMDVFKRAQDSSKENGNFLVRFRQSERGFIMARTDASEQFVEQIRAEYGLTGEAAAPETTTEPEETETTEGPTTEIEEPSIEERQEALKEIDDQTKLDYVFFAIQPDNTEIAAINDRKPKNVLLSYYYWKDKDIQRDLLDKLDYKPRILIDSGAYTFFNQGVSSPTGIQEMIDYYAGELTFEPEYIISLLRSDRNNPYYDEDLDEIVGPPEEIPEQSIFLDYIDWLGENDNVIDYVIAFDEIGNQQTSNNAFLLMKDHFPSIPVATYVSSANEELETWETRKWWAEKRNKPFNEPRPKPVYEEDKVQEMINAVQYFVDNGADYVALGGLSTNAIKDHRNLRARIANEVTRQFPDIKFHFLGTLDNRIIKQVPGLTSADGTAWVTSAIQSKNRKEGQTKWDGAKDNIDRMGEMQRPESPAEEPAAETPTDPDEIRARGDRTTVVTPRNTEIEVQYAVVEVNNLITSNNDSGSINSEYPSELQPRDRTRGEMRQQINEIAGTLNPILLGENPLATNGAPIIGSDLVVESGNGRSMALRKVYSDDSYNEQRSRYMRWLIDNAAEFGIDPDALELMQNPVLVRVRRTDIDRVEFTQEANDTTTARMGPTERALDDARKMSNGLMNLFAPTDTGELNNSVNRPFIVKFMNDVVAKGDRNALTTGEGVLNQDGINRVRNAVFAYAYGDPTAVSTLAESTDNNVRSILNQLLIAASRVAKAQDNIRNGSYFDLSINDNIVEAMNTLSDLRRNGQKVDQFLRQMSLLDEMSDVSKEFLRFLDEYGSGRKGKPASTISALILEYYRGLEVLGNPNQESLFEDLETPTVDQLLEVSIRKVTGSDALQGSLFETEEEQNVPQDRPAANTDEQGDNTGSEAAPAPEETTNAEIPTLKETSDWKVGQQAELIGNFITFKRENVTIEEVLPKDDRFIKVKRENGEVKRVALTNLRLPGFYVDALPENPSDVDSEHFQRYAENVAGLIDLYIRLIESDSLPRTQGDLRQRARFEMDRDVTEDEWRDALEAAVQIVMSRRVTKEMSLQERIEVGNELEQLLKTTGRSLEQVERQQYSTPLALAQIANFALDPQTTDVVKEGSAGTGSLILPLTNQVDQVKAIELSPRRAAILQRVSAEMGNLTVRNASTFDYKPRATAVIGNPPFKGQNKGAGTVQFSGKAPWGAWGDLGNRFLLWDLQRSLQDNGRLAYIVSPGVIDNKQNSPFRQWLRENHTVRAFVKFPPGVYDTRGTKFGAGLIVVDKGKIEGAPEPITGEPETLEQLVELLEPLRGGTHGRKTLDGNVSTDDDTSGTEGNNTNATVGGRKPGRRGSTGTSTGGRDGDRVDQPSTTGTGTSNSGGTGSKRGGKNQPNGDGAKGPRTNVEESSNLPTELQPAVGPSKSDELSTIPKNENSVGEVIDELPSVTRYVPRRRVSGQEHPGLVIEAPGMQFVSMPEAIYNENQYLPHPRVIEGGEWKLSDIQIESVMAAKYNFLVQEKRGILIADDTGMGKTAQLLGIAADSWHSGRTSRILMITVKDQVATSSFIPENQKFNFGLPITHIDKEFSDKYERNFKDDVFKNEPDNWKPLDIGEGVVLMSQYTFRDSQEAVRKWLHDADGDVLVLVDESHAFKNIDGKGGLALKDLTTSLNEKAQFIYASATAAEELEGLEHLFGLKVWGANDFNEFQAKLTGMDTGGVSGGKKKTGMAASMSKKSPFARDIPLTLMEQITRELKMNGQYIGRQLSMEGVTMEGMRVKLSSKDKGDWNRAVQFIQLIAEKAEEHGKKPTDRGRIMGSVVGYMRRLRGYYALKGIIEDIKKQQKAGTFNRFAISAFYVSGDEGEPAQLQNAIKVINDTDTKKAGNGDTIIVDIPEAIEDKADLMAILQGLDPEWGENPVPELPSPIEMLYQAFGEDTVAVVHGQVKPADRPKFVREFQEGKKKIIWFNEAGATGVNMHDTINDRIRFYHQDYPYAAKVAKQAEGRVNRTGQVTTPNYVYPYLDTSVDTKFVGTLMARYESMGALSRGDTAQIGGGELANFDFTGKAAENAAYRIIPLLEPELRAKMFGNWTRDLFNDPAQQLDETTIRSVYGGKVEVKKFMNALMLLEFDEGNEVFNLFSEVMAQAKREIEANGGMVDKFVTYNGVQLDLTEATGGIKLRTIETKLTPEQERSLKTKLRIAKESIEQAKEGLEKATQDALRHAESRLEEIQNKQNEEEQEIQTLNEQMRQYIGRRGNTEEDLKKLERLRTKRDNLMDSVRKRDNRIREQNLRIKGIEENNSDVVDKLPDLRRAQVYLDMAELRLLGAESDIERASEVMLVDGRIATNGLLVPIRKAIRKAAEKHYKGTVPATALQLELRGYYLENNERVVGALVPKWAEAEVAAALEARMRYRGGKNDIAKLKAHIQSGNPITLENGFEIRWAPKLEQFQIWGMTLSSHRTLFEQLVGDKRSPDIGYHQTSRSFVILKDEGFQKLIERFGLAIEGATGIRQLEDRNGRTTFEIQTPTITEPSIRETITQTFNVEAGEETYEFKRVSPQTARDVATLLAKSMNTLFRKLKTSRRSIAGWYQPFSGGGRVRKEKASDIRVLAHELGHAFSDKFGFPGDKKELIGLYEKYYPGQAKSHTVALKMEEGRAEFFLLYLTDSEQALKDAPKTFSQFEAFLTGPDMGDVSNAIAESQRLIANELDGSAISQGMGSIFQPGGRNNERPENYYGEEYKTARWKKVITSIFDFTLPWRDMFEAARKNGYEGLDFTKLMAISGNAKEKARTDFTARPTDYQGRYIINYKTSDEIPEFLEPLFNAYHAKYGSVERALEEVNNRTFQTILIDATDAINKRLGSITNEQLENLSLTRKELRDHGSYMIFSTISQAYRYNERAERGFKDNPMSSEVAKNIIDESRLLFPEVENLVREYTNNLSEVILAKLKRVGVISEEDRQRILKGSDFYIPTYYATKGNGVGGNSGGRTAGKVVKRYSGSREIVYDMATATLYKLTETEQSVEMKRTLNAIEKSLLGTPGMNAFGTFVEEDKIPVKVRGDAIGKQIDDLLDEPIAEDAIGDMVFQIFLPAGMNSKTNQPILMNYHGKKKVYMQVAPDLFNAFLSMRPAEIDGITRIIARTSQIVRYTATTLNPRYHWNAFWRDAFTAAIQSKTRNPFRVIPETFRYLSVSFGKGGEEAQRLRDQYMTAGSFMSSTENLLASMSRASITDGLIPLSAQGLKKTKNGKKYMKMVAPIPGDILQAFEQVQRYPEFKNTVIRLSAQYGIDPDIVLDGRKEIPAGKHEIVDKILIEAGHAASEITTNFALHGTMNTFRTGTSAVPFLHGTLQGMYREFRAFKSPKDAGKTLSRLLLIAAPISILSYALMKAYDDDDDYSSETRDRYWILPFGPPESRLKLTIPKPFTYALPLNYLERMYDSSINKDEARKIVNDWFNPLKQAFLGIPLTPPFMGTLIDLWANKAWHGGEIVPSHEKRNWIPAEQYDPLRTGTLAKWFSQSVSDLTGGKTVSPRKVDYFLNNFMGPAGEWGNNAASWAIEQISNYERPEGKPKPFNFSQPEYMPVFGTVILGPNEGGSRSIDFFYKKYDKSNKLNSTAGKWAKEAEYQFSQGNGSWVPPTRITEEMILELRRNSGYNKLSEIMGILRDEERAVLKSKDYTTKEKYEIQVRSRYLQKLIANLTSPEIPEPPKAANLNGDQVLEVRQRFLTEADQAVQKEVKSKGGASEKAQYLEMFKQYQDQKKQQ